MHHRRSTLADVPAIVVVLGFALVCLPPDASAQDRGPTGDAPGRTSSPDPGAQPKEGVPPAQAPAAAQPTPSPSPTATMERLLARLAAMPGLSATFREEKHLALLAAPFVNEGTMHYARRGPEGRAVLARHTLRPVRSTVLIDDRALRVGDADGAQTLDLAGNPVLRQFLDSFLPLLRGDESTLEATYEVRFELAGPASSDPARPEDGGWVLTLRPRRSPMKDVIERIEFRGAGLVFERMRVAEVGGDETVTTFSDVDVDRRYTAEEAAQVFRLPARGR